MSADGSEPVSEATRRAIEAGRVGFQRADKPGAASKFDASKPRLDLLPFDAIESVADVLGFGARKYADHNWAKGMAWSRLIGAALRHVFAFARGEDRDAESGLPHLAHAACCILFLLAYSLRRVGEDDRFRVPGAK